MERDANRFKILFWDGCWNLPISDHGINIWCNKNRQTSAYVESRENVPEEKWN